jgi:hypothetical protein
MSTDRASPQDSNDFRIALIAGGVVFALALGLAIWVKRLDQAPQPIQTPTSVSASEPR